MSTGVVVPIRPMRDSVDTAIAFGLELDNSSRATAPPKRRTGVGRLAVVAGLFAVLLALILLASPAAKADNVSRAYAASNSGQVCQVVADEPNVVGLMGILARMRNEGLSHRQAAEALVESVSGSCPEYLFVIEAFANRGVMV